MENLWIFSSWGVLCLLLLLLLVNLAHVIIL
jgi:hypothetical protein